MQKPPEFIVNSPEAFSIGFLPKQNDTYRSTPSQQEPYRLY